MNKFSRVISKINYYNKPVRILTYATHEGFQASMAGCNAEFVMIPSPEGKKWDSDYRKIPDNFIELDTFNSNSVEYAHVGLSHTISQREHMQRICFDFNIPHINMLHVYPFYNKRITGKIKADNKVEAQVFTTKNQAEEWGYVDGEYKIIEHGIDTDLFSGWENGNYILTIANFYKDRGSELGYDLYEKIRGVLSQRGINFKHVGKSNNGESKAAESVEALACEYKKCGIFLNTATRSVVPTTLLEAMATGCICVSTVNPTIDNLIIDGVNGFKADSLEKFIYIIEHIVNTLTPEKALEISTNARNTILNEYSLDKFVSNWDNLFMEVNV